MTSHNLYVASIIIAVTLGGILILFPFLKQKGINVGKILSEIKAGLEEIKTGLAVVKEIAPNTPQLAVLDIVEKGAEIGVNKAQQMYISSQLPIDQRKQSAIETAESSVIESNIPLSDNLKKLISDAVESKVFNLKTDTEKTTGIQSALQLQNNQLQSQIAQVTAINTQLQSQVADLTNKINTVQATVTTIQA